MIVATTLNQDFRDEIDRADHGSVIAIERHRAAIFMTAQRLDPAMRQSLGPVINLDICRLGRCTPLPDLALLQRAFAKGAS